MKRVISTIVFIILFFVVTTFVIAYFLINNGSFLTRFKFKSVSNAGLNYYVYYTKVPASVKYDVFVYDSNNEIVYKNETKNTSLTIEFDSLKYMEIYKIIVFAIDKDGNKKSIDEPFTFIWDELDFSDDNPLVMDNNADYDVLFIGDYKNKDYYLNVYKDDYLIDTKKIDNEVYTISNSDFKDEKCTYKFEIVDSSLVISTLRIYNLSTPITDITFINPSEGDIMDYNDVNISFSGGDNASDYLFELYRGDKLVRRKEIKSKNIVLSNNLFEKSASYTVKITASYYDYVDYSKTNEVSFTINPKESLKPVYINKNYNNIKSGTKIKLLSPDEDATIYYTLDGSDPTKDSIKYENEIEIKDNVTIKAISIKDKFNDSEISTFDVKVGNKSKYKVYLSPSNQSANIGVRETGFTNEANEMNDLTNYIEKKLKDSGVIVYRNERIGGINRWTQDSTYLGVDLHLAIHSNASESHTSYGIETWVENYDSKMYSLAWNIQSNLFDMYYKKDDPIANRGVKYARGSLGEVNPLYTPCGILIEVAHHDYSDDAQWIMDNKEKIGNKIADVVLEYFQIK